tara:strand:+ start:352 stop:504 length:153 start_codon:yes stop_codon:yes gene_type:complete
MRVVLVFIFFGLICSCSVYDTVKENASDAYEWSVDKKDQAVEVIEEAVSE